MWGAGSSSKLLWSLFPTWGNKEAAGCTGESGGWRPEGSVLVPTPLLIGCGTPAGTHPGRQPRCPLPSRGELFGHTDFWDSCHPIILGGLPVDVKPIWGCANPTSLFLLKNFIVKWVNEEMWAESLSSMSPVQNAGGRESFFIMVSRGSEPRNQVQDTSCLEMCNRVFH